MATIIYHASKDENGKYRGGKAGDQTGTEVYARNWYNRPWKVVYRAKDRNVAHMIAECAKAGVYNNNIGYDQANRNTCFALAKPFNFDLSKINTPCELDCSALVSICAIYAGVPESLLYVNGNCATTSTLGDALMKSGMFEKLTDLKYLITSDYLLEGDILIYPGKHTAINGTNGSKASTSATASNSLCPYNEPTYLLKAGMRNTGVSWLQWNLNVLISKGIINLNPLKVDGDWGSNTSKVFKAFQELYPETGTNGKPDGKCGPACRSKLKSLV